MAIGAVAFGITALILTSGFAEWLFMDFREGTIQSQLGHLQIVRPGYHDTGKSDPYAFLLPETIPELEAPNEARKINIVAPRLSFSGLISHADATLSFIGDGVDPTAEAAFTKGVVISAGDNLSADAPRAIIMGEGLARNLGVKVGDTVILLATTASGSTNAVEVSVRGLFSTVAKAYDDAALRLPLTTARALLRTKSSHAWVVLLHRTSDTDAVLASLQAKLPPGQFEVVPWYVLADTYNKIRTMLSKQIEGIRLIIAIIILLSISNTMTMSVIERIGEIGTCMALGIRRIGILRVFLSEGILLGCIGGALGIAVGIAAGKVISVIGIPMPPPPGAIHGFSGQIVVTWKIALESFALAVATTLVASVYPAWTASRKQIVDSLRFNR